MCMYVCIYIYICATSRGPSASDTVAKGGAVAGWLAMACASLIDDNNDNNDNNNDNDNNIEIHIYIYDMIFTYKQQ